MEMYIEIAKENYKGFIKENVFELKDDDGCVIGRGMLNPVFNYDVSGNVPLNIFFDIEVYENDLKSIIMDMLFDKIITKIRNILRELDEISGRICTSCAIDDISRIDYFEKKGLDEKSSVVVVQRRIPENYNFISEDSGIRIKESELNDEYEINRFLDFQNKIFFYKMNKMDIDEFKRKDGAIIFNAYDENRVVGSALAYIKNNNVGYLKLIFVAKKYRKTKVGMELISKCYEYFEKMNIEYIQLEVPTMNTGAIEFYKKLGFQMLKEKYVYMIKTFHKEEKEIDK
ncbi:MAG: GNAT family N-acetyltransferase [Firmicutes bacterium]|jgi:ribosomal protein S18 acetylase RimI-like enzyme|nr:GNAT family N-acetyltransferase [Bacillota bacterium]